MDLHHYDIVFLVPSAGVAALTPLCAARIPSLLVSQSWFDLAFPNFLTEGKTYPSLGCFWIKTNTSATSSAPSTSKICVAFLHTIYTCNTWMAIIAKVGEFLVLQLTFLQWNWWPFTMKAWKIAFQRQLEISLLLKNMSVWAWPSPKMFSSTTSTSDTFWGRHRISLVWILGNIKSN